MKPTHIIIHHSLTEDGKTVSWDAIRKYHVETNGWNDIGYHYGIELVNDRYEILVGRMQDVVGAHCKEQGMNNASLGICLIGNFDIYSPLPVQLDMLVKLVRSLQTVFNIPVNSVHKHSEFAPKSCPGNMFPWDAFKTMLAL